MLVTGRAGAAPRDVLDRIGAPVVEKPFAAADILAACAGALRAST